MTRSFPKTTVTLAVASTLPNVLGFAIAKQKLVRDLGMDNHTVLVLTPFKHSAKDYYEIASLMLRALEADSSNTLVIKNSIATRIVSRIAISSAKYESVRWIFTCIFRALILYVQLRRQVGFARVLVFRPRPNWSVNDECLPEEVQQVFYGDGFSLHCPRIAPLWTNSKRLSAEAAQSVVGNTLRTYLYTYPDQAELFRADAVVAKQQPPIGERNQYAIEIPKRECREFVDLVTAAIEPKLREVFAKISTGKPLLILTTSTFHGSGVMSDHDEIKLYWDAVAEQLATDGGARGKSGQQLLIKFHPSTSVRFKEALSTYCSNQGLPCLQENHVIDDLPLEVILNALKRCGKKIATIVVCSVGAAYASRLVLPEVKAVTISENAIRKYVAASSLDLRLKQNALINRIISSW